MLFNFFSCFYLGFIPPFPKCIHFDVIFILFGVVSLFFSFVFFLCCFLSFVTGQRVSDYFVHQLRACMKKKHIQVINCFTLFVSPLDTRFFAFHRIYRSLISLLIFLNDKSVPSNRFKPQFQIKFIYWWYVHSTKLTTNTMNKTHIRAHTYTHSNKTQNGGKTKWKIYDEKLNRKSKQKSPFWIDKLHEILGCWLVCIVSGI